MKKYDFFINGITNISKGYNVVEYNSINNDILDNVQTAINNISFFFPNLKEKIKVVFINDVTTNMSYLNVDSIKEPIILLNLQFICKSGYYVNSLLRSVYYETSHYLFEWDKQINESLYTKDVKFEQSLHEFFSRNFYDYRDVTEMYNLIHDTL